MSFHKTLNKQGYIIKKDQIEAKLLKEIKKELTVKPIVFKAYQDFVKPTEFPIYQESPNYLYLPRYYGIEKFGPPEKNLLPSGASTDLNFIFNLLPHQIVGYEKSLKTLKEIGGGVLSLPCGYGKTSISIKLSIDMKSKTLIVVNKECLMDQWNEAIAKFTGGKARIGIIQQSKIDVENKDFVIAMLHSLSKKDYDKGIFADFGMCIVDECHHIGSEMFSQALPKISCKYMLGLSATPKRKDGLSNVFYSYIGPLFHSEKRKGSNRVLVKRFKLTSSTTYYETLFMSNGIKNTGAMVTNLSKYEPRTQLIIESIRTLMTQDRKILLLSGRREHLEDIYEALGKAEIKNFQGKTITFGYYYGNQGMSKVDHKSMLTKSAKCDIVLGTYSIAAEGLDLPDLNTEILATPSTDVEQSVGRILRKFHDKVNPLVLDFIDQCGNFPKQATQRAHLYKDEQYEIQDIKIPLGHSSQELQPFLKEIHEYLFDTNFKQSKFAYKEKDEDDEEEGEHNQPTKIGQCLLDDGDSSKLPIKITLKKSENKKGSPNKNEEDKPLCQDTSNQKDSIAQTSSTQIDPVTQIQAGQKEPDKPAPVKKINKKVSLYSQQDQIDLAQKLKMKNNKARIVGVSGGKVVKMNLGLCVLDD